MRGRWMREAVEVELFTDADEKKLQVSVFVRASRTGFRKFCERLRELVPELAGAGGFRGFSTGGAATRTEAAPVGELGSGWAQLSSAADESYWVSRGGFFQVNRFLLDELVNVVTTGRSGALAWDLYAGVGLFSRALTRGFEKVVAVEAAGNDLTASFKGPGRHAVEGHYRGVSARGGGAARAARAGRHGPSTRWRGSGGLCFAGAAFCDGDGVRLVRSGNSGARFASNGRSWLLHHGTAHGRPVSSDVSSGDGGRFAQVIVVALW